ncbi:MAG: adenosylhomocysteinase [Candidatus Kapabacteria bacterium]|nr:adenosylhomocysteinase [Candidatus Kapabacteria bacterium]MDW7997668.1 adenosylhomocysteinase [Bacteroidota bacterium]
MSYPPRHSQEPLDEKPGQYCIRNLSLSEEGFKLIEWAESHMPVLMELRRRYSDSKPFAGYHIAGCLHVTKETAVLIRAFAAAGAEVSWSGCNPLSTNDAVAAALAAEGLRIFAWHGNTEDFYWCIERTLDCQPHLALDDGADLITTTHEKYPELAARLIGGTEETTTGVNRLRARARQGKLAFPVIAVNDAETKWDFDNVYGTGQSTIDGILRATSVMLAGKIFVVAGYGHCGSGVARRARGMGARVIVTEVHPTAALKAVLEGYEVLPMDEAARIGDIFCTATGMRDVIRRHHFELMKDGAILCNTGHYDVEINLLELEEMVLRKRELRPNCTEYVLRDGKRLYVLAQGRLVNLAAAEGHPSEVMDMSFANQFLAHLHLVELHKQGKRLPIDVLPIPPEQDELVARMKLETMGIRIDELTPEQLRYRSNYLAGT